jgi:hypothetical protein
MEMSQGNKISLFFFFLLLQNWRTGGKNKSCLGGGIGISGRGDEVGKGHGRVNIVQILCPYACKWKNGIP